MPRPYPLIEDGKWLRPDHSGYKFRCCRCRGVWTLTVDPRPDGRVEAEFVRDARATAVSRRGYGLASDKTPDDDALRFILGRNSRKHVCPDCYLGHDLTGRVRDDGQVEIKLVRDP